MIQIPVLMVEPAKKAKENLFVLVYKIGKDLFAKVSTGISRL